MLLKLRGDLVEEGDTPFLITAGIKGWEVSMRSPALYELSGRAASLGTNLIKGKDGQLHNLPSMLGNWTQYRDFPPFAKKSFRQQWREKQKAKSESK
ncbi:MAG: lactate utilization protein LutB domain-containing protein [Anaerolineae bacterium]